MLRLDPRDDALQERDLDRDRRRQQRRHREVRLRLADHVGDQVEERGALVDRAGDDQPGHERLGEPFGLLVGDVRHLLGRPVGHDAAGHLLGEERYESDDHRDRADQPAVARLDHLALDRRRLAGRLTADHEHHAGERERPQQHRPDDDLHHPDGRGDLHMEVGHRSGAREGGVFVTPSLTPPTYGRNASEVARDRRVVGRLVGVDRIAIDRALVLSNEGDIRCEKQQGVVRALGAVRRGGRHAG